MHHVLHIFKVCTRGTQCVPFSRVTVKTRHLNLRTQVDGNFFLDLYAHLKIVPNYTWKELKSTVSRHKEKRIKRPTLKLTISSAFPSWKSVVNGRSTLKGSRLSPLTTPSDFQHCPSYLFKLFYASELGSSTRFQTGEYWILYVFPYPCLLIRVLISHTDGTSLNGRTAPNHAAKANRRGKLNAAWTSRRTNIDQATNVLKIPNPTSRRQKDHATPLPVLRTGIPRRGSR